MLRTTLLCLMLTLSVEAFSQPQLLRIMSGKLALDVKECRTEVKTDETPDGKIERFGHFWSDEFEFDMWADGCVAECVLLRHNLLNQRGEFRLSQSIDFLRSCGADDEQIHELIEMMTTHCKMSELMPQLPPVDQPARCVRPLLTAICFRHGVFKSMSKHDWPPIKISTNITLKLFA